MHDHEQIEDAFQLYDALDRQNSHLMIYRQFVQRPKQRNADAHFFCG